ncbi:MAG: PSD1 and planctomycete cytochrome C domain-containing protein [Planctomycetota bacterium]|nr:PSD1 and planctomycete cytochrome C domain-containing protein [Planctomycetota bacterium]MDA1248132.1 PSD1 and planctomycete cytochrome C domain-containing protein [Planctomycetota bacterium]
MLILRDSLVLLSVLSVIVSGTDCLAADPKLNPDDVEFFEKKIRPVLVERCFECHSAKADEIGGGLLLDNRAAVAKGGENGPVLVKGNPDQSRLITALRYSDEKLQMPPDGKLPADLIADFEQWVKTGAPDPRDGAAPVLVTSIEARAKSHWSFSPPKKTAVPSVLNTAWSRSDLDRLVLAKLEAKSIEPSPQAAPRDLVRRLFFDLTGLPPTYADVKSFEEDSSNAAFEKLVDRLLGSEQFGERWARHWLDLSRFGDTKGYVFQEDRNYPNAFRYRDWVINSLNQDRPYDEFLKLQIAADHLVTGEDKADLAAMGFLTLGRRFINNINDIIDDRIDVVFRGTMGLTATCARCHNHKYDPISTEDYYSLYGVFWSSDDKQDEGLPLRLIDKPKPTDVQIFIRGNHQNRGAGAPRRFPVFFASDSAERYTETSGRLQMAERITDPTNPLTARVFVNRVWSHLFGRGLVSTTSDFGLRSDEPVQRDTLDHLAVSFVEDGWSIKKLIRRIVQSSVYRQRSDVREAASKLDPENFLLWRVERRRLNFEAMRDALLAVSSTLDRKVCGPSEKIETLPPTKRRTLYAFIDRQNLPGVFRTFDFASPDTHSPSRPETTVPQQALFLMNNGFSHAITESLVARLDPRVPDEERIRLAYRQILARDPDAEELALGRLFVSGSTSGLAISSPWQFGYGLIDEAGKVDFTPLPHFENDSWQGGPQRPDPKLGWCILNRDGGHPGNDPKHMVIRRWVSPIDGVISVKGVLDHPAKEGDGVRGRVISSRLGERGTWTARSQKVTTNVDRVEVHKGDHLDVVTDCLSSPNHDSFQWTVNVQVVEASTPDSARNWNSRDQFHGPPPDPLSRWQQYAQALILTNEFLFLD